MKNKIKYLFTLLFSIGICIGMMYVLYIDINYFITRKEGGAEILSIYEKKGRNPFNVQLKYHNDFINKTVACVVNVGAHDAQMITDKYKNENQIEIFYAKGYPYKVYIEEINSPRWLIIFFEISIILIMSFSIYSCVKIILKNDHLH